MDRTRNPQDRPPSGPTEAAPIRWLLELAVAIGIVAAAALALAVLIGIVH